MGEFPDYGAAEVEDNDPQRIVKLTAHAIARMADRFPLSRRVSRHLEGTDRRAGILSDLVGAFVALYNRNPQAIETFGRQLGSEFQTRRAERVQASRNGKGNPQPEATYAQ